MNILLVTATSQEMQAVLSGFASPPVESLLEELSAFPVSMGRNIPSCSLGKWTFFLCICGVGPVSAALHTGLALGALQASHIPLHGLLNLGIAGTYDPALAPPGSLVQASCEIFPEYGLCTAQGVDAKGIAFPQATLLDGPVFDRLPPASPNPSPRFFMENGLGNMGLSCHNSWLNGVSVTVSGVSGTPDRATFLAQHTGGIMENMEGFALALGAARSNIAFAEIRAISNCVGHRPPHTWDIPGAFAALARIIYEATGEETVPPPDSRPPYPQFA